MYSGFPAAIENIFGDQIFRKLSEVILSLFSVTFPFKTLLKIVPGRGDHFGDHRRD